LTTINILGNAQNADIRTVFPETTYTLLRKIFSRWARLRRPLPEGGFSADFFAAATLEPCKLLGKPPARRAKP
jgi:hypothetical protein